MKKFFIVPLFFLFWCVSALFRDPQDLIPVAGAAAVLCLILLPRRRAVCISAAAAVAVGVSIFNVQFLLRCVPALLLVLAHGKAAKDARTAEKNKARPEAVYTAVIFVFLIALAALVSDIVSASQIPRTDAPSRFYWVLAGIVLFFTAAPAAGGRAAAEKNRKPRAERYQRGAFLLIWICGGICALAASVGCLLNSEADVFCAAFSWLIFAAIAGINGDAVLSDAFRRLGGAGAKLFSVSE